MVSLYLDSASSNAHTAASLGDLELFKSLLENGANINALDKRGKTTLYCAIDNQHAGSCEDLVRFIVTHPSISLRTLNAHCFPTGMTPLSLAAANGMLNIVRVLLEDSTGSVSVDATNEDSSTALSHAILHGHSIVSQTLLQNGARPDFRSRENCTPIQQAVSHPQILRICENVLRRHRWRSSQIISSSTFHKVLLTVAAASLVPVSRQYAMSSPLSLPLQVSVSLVNAVLVGDLPQLQTILFPPASTNECGPLVNLFDDQKGWGLIHYCAAARLPSTAVLDCLYYAGAELSMITNDGRQWTLLHCLARYARAVPEVLEHAEELENFLVHAVYDLRAPITATDAEGETCLHIAAEHGECLEVIQILAHIDNQGSHGLSSMKNNRGLTPLQVARAEFRAILGGDADNYRPASALTIRAIKPKSSMSSMQPASPQALHQPLSSPDCDVSLLIPQLFEDLSIISPHTVTGSLEAITFEETLDRCHDSVELILNRHRLRVADASLRLEKLKKMLSRVEGLRDKVVISAHEQLDQRELQPVYPANRRRHRDSEDSQTTAVSSEFECSTLSVNEGLSKLKTSSTPDLASLCSEHALKPRPSISHENLPMLVEPNPSPLPDAKKSPSKLKRWFKKMTKSTAGYKRTLTSSPHGSAINLSQLESENSAHVEDSADQNLVRVPFILDLVWLDLSAIHQKATLAEEHVQKTLHYIEKTSRIAKRALNKREVALQHIRDLEEYAEFADLFTRPPNRDSFTSVLAQFPITPNTLSTHPSIASFSSVAPSSPTYHHTPPSPTSCEDEDVTSLRRLLVRKLEAQFALAQTEIDHCDSWLHTVRDVVQGVKRQAYL